jgi:hypothetical protein
MMGNSSRFEKVSKLGKRHGAARLVDGNGWFGRFGELGSPIGDSGRFFAAKG